MRRFKRLPYFPMAIPISYSFRNLWTRRLTTVLTASGMALVVFVFAATLMLAEGLQKTLVETGSTDNVVVIRKSSDAGGAERRRPISGGDRREPAGDRHRGGRQAASGQGAGRPHQPAQAGGQQTGKCGDQGGWDASSLRCGRRCSWSRGACRGRAPPRSLPERALPSVSREAVLARPCVSACATGPWWGSLQPVRPVSIRRYGVMWTSSCRPSAGRSIHRSYSGCATRRNSQGLKERLESDPRLTVEASGKRNITPTSPRRWPGSCASSG